MGAKNVYSLNSYIKYTSLIIVFLIVFTYSNFFKNLFQSIYLKEEIIYGIILDAGSTGTRLHVYHFLNLSSKVPLLYKGEIFKEIEPGLSSFAHNVNSAIETLHPLLHVAKLHIPHFKWNYTSIHLKATAGLRLLPSTIKQEIMNEVHKLFIKFPFKKDKVSATIISGEEEGIMAWTTINYLLGRYDHCDQFFGGIDLGGASFQITSHICVDLLNPPIKGKHLSYFGRKYKVYTSSFLGYGLMSARYKILGGTINDTFPLTPFTSHFRESYCVNNKYTIPFNYQGTDLVIKGKKLPANYDDHYEACYLQIKHAFATDLDHCIHSNNHPCPQKFGSILSNIFYVFSYFFDRAYQVNLVTSHSGSKIKVAHYCHMAKQVCNGKVHQKPLLCMDLTYICILLVEQLGFHPNQTIMVAKKINDTEISWSLGSALQMMNLVSYE